MASSIRLRLLHHDWTVSKLGARPSVPDPIPLDSNWVLLKKLPELQNVTVGPDGITPLYRVSGVYVYGRRTAPSNTYDASNFPLPLYLEDQYARDIPATLLKKGISDTPGSSSISSTSSQKQRSIQQLTGFIQ